MILPSTLVAKLTSTRGRSGIGLRREAGEDRAGVGRGVFPGADLHGQGDAEATEGHDEVEVVDRAVLVEEELAHRCGVVALEGHDDSERCAFQVTSHPAILSAGTTGRLSRPPAHHRIIGSGRERWLTA